jgi:hypothetical protein
MKTEEDGEQKLSINEMISRFSSTLMNIWLMLVVVF